MGSGDGGDLRVDSGDGGDRWCFGLDEFRLGFSVLTSDLHGVGPFIT